MKKVFLLILAELLLTINSCDFLVDHYEDKDVFATYYMGNSIIVSEGSRIVKKSVYEYHKNTCDRTEFFIIYQEDIVEDIVYEWNSERHIDFVANKTNAQKLGWATSGLSTHEKKPNEKYSICTAEILKDINLQKVDSIIIEIFYTMN